MHADEQSSTGLPPWLDCGRSPPFTSLSFVPVHVKGVILKCVQMHKQVGAFRGDGIASSTANNGYKTLNMLKGAPLSVRANSQMEKRNGKVQEDKKRWMLLPGETVPTQ